MPRVQTWHKNNRARINETTRARYVPKPKGTCAVEGCPAELRSSNKTGYCKNHHGQSPHYKAKKAERSVGSDAWQIRRARKAGAFVEQVVRSVVWTRDEGICHICETEADSNDWHLDHVIALANGGEHSYANVKVSHPKCNLSKGTK